MKLENSSITLRFSELAGKSLPASARFRLLDNVGTCSDFGSLYRLEPDGNLKRMRGKRVRFAPGHPAGVDHLLALVRL